MNADLRLPAFRFVKTTLGNGLDVIVRRQGDLPLVAVNLWYHVGSKNEERRQRGFAHLFEHLMFEGSEHYPGDFFQPLQRRGAAVNGSTSADRTNYYEDLPAAHLELALAMESDRMAHLLPALTATKLRVQKDVVKNEYRQNYANRPYGQAWRLLSEVLYPPEHPYSWLTIGAMEDIEAATQDDVEAFFRRFYVPSNASLCLVGDLDEDRALTLAERYFGAIPGGAGALRPWAPPAVLASSVTMRLHDRVELDRIYDGWHSVPQFHPDDAPLTLLADILARGKASRLYRKLVVEEQLAQDVTAAQTGRELAGTFSIVVTLRPQRSWELTRERIEAELAAIAWRGVTEEELSRVRHRRVAGFIYALEDIGGFGGVADRLNAYNVYLGDPGGITSDVDRFQQVTAERVQDVARRYLVGEHRASLTVRGRSSPTVLPPPLDRRQVPEPSRAVAFQAPAPECLPLSGGAALWVIPRRELPIVAATVVVPAGAASHGPDRGGLASLTASMMTEGTATRSAFDLAIAAESLGTLLTSTCGWDGSYVSLQCLTPHLDASLDLAVDVLRAAAFPESEWARVQGQALAGLRSERDRAESRAYRAFLRAIYGPDHPYRVALDGEEPTVSGLSREDLVQFHRDRYRPDPAAVIVAGDVEPDAVARRLDDRLADWSGRASRWSLPERLEPADTPRILILDRPAAAQAAVRLGHVGCTRLDPDYENLLVLNQILGGQFTSRLNETLREQKGLTYGVRSHFDFRRGPGPFSVGTAVQTDGVAEAVALIRAEIEALRGDRPPTPQELDDARRSLIEGQARHFETPSALVARYANLFLHGLPPDDHARFADRIDAVTLDTLRHAAVRHLRPETLVAVVVADASLVVAPLEQLGWAHVEVIDEAQTY